MNDTLTSAIRTAVPYVVSSVVAWLTTKGFHVSDASVASMTAFLTFGVGTLYYVVVRGLEKRYPRLGYFLGVPKAPTYTK